jgi:hypothetical protein
VSGIVTSMTDERDYRVVDVFTDRAYGGNPLAVVLDGEGLSTQRMQSIAREFNLAETLPAAAQLGRLPHRGVGLAAADRSHALEPQAPLPDP